MKKDRSKARKERKDMRQLRWYFKRYYPDAKEFGLQWKDIPEYERDRLEKSFMYKAWCLAQEFKLLWTVVLKRVFKLIGKR